MYRIRNAFIRRSAALVFGAGAFAATSVRAGVIRNDRPDSSYLSLANRSAYAPVGRFDGTSAQGGFLASGTLVDKQWVLTAGHVVAGTTSLKFTVGGKSYAGNLWGYYPSYDGDPSAGHDIGLVHLSAPVKGIAPAKLYNGISETSRLATFVGYGKTGVGTTGATKLDFRKRAGQNAIDLISSNVLYSDFDNPANPRLNLLGSSSPVNLEYSIAPGDSGGGLFIPTPYGDRLAGVNSFGASLDGNTNSSYGDYFGDTRVGPFRDWIYSVINGKASYYNNGPVSAAGVFFSTPVPEPAGLALISLGGLILTGRRRKPRSSARQLSH